MTAPPRWNNTDDGMQVAYTHGYIEWRKRYIQKKITFTVDNHGPYCYADDFQINGGWVFV